MTIVRDAHGISERRACSIIGADRSAMRYRHRRSDDAATRMRLKELAAERRRFGWRRLKLLLEREGIRMNPPEAASAVWRGTAAGASSWWPQASAWHTSADDTATGAEPTLVAGLRCRHADRRSEVPHPGGGGRLHPRMPAPCGRHVAVWSGARVARELKALIARRGARPLLCVSDNGTEPARVHRRASLPARAVPRQVPHHGTSNHRRDPARRRGRPASPEAHGHRPPSRLPLARRSTPARPRLRRPAACSATRRAPQPAVAISMASSVWGARRVALHAAGRRSRGRAGVLRRARGRRDGGR